MVVFHQGIYKNGTWEWDLSDKVRQVPVWAGLEPARWAANCRVLTKYCQYRKLE
jgi:hypothetical protein